METAGLNLTGPDPTPYDDHKIDFKFTTFQQISIAFYGIIFVLGIIGNGLVIWIAGFRMKKTISSTWLLNLAIADFLCCASLPVRIADWVDYFSDSLIIFCISSMIVFNLNMSASVFTLTAMSIDRCVSVMWPFWAKVHRTRKVLRITVAIIWVLSLILTGLVYLIYGAFHSYSEWCSIVLDIRPPYGYELILLMQLIRLLIMFVIPFLIISISYACIFLKIRKSKRPRRSQRPYRIITAVILCFFICWTPYYILPLIPIDDSYFIGYITVYLISIILACLNSCINPIIYVFMGQDFQHNFLRSIPIRLEKALSEHPNDPCEEQEYCRAAGVPGV